MLESLKYVAVFNSTGRTLKNQIIFKPGITVLVGENEAGKSFVFEMIRYAIYGSDALRGLKEDYDKLEVTLVMSVKGKKYTIVRTGNRATVNVNEAVGTTAVNKFMTKLIGFGLPVFDIAANAKQGELDRLTKDLKPAERRKLIDEVTGLNLFEVAEKDCRDESNTLRKIAEALEAQLIEPVAPIKPDDYEESSVLKERLDKEIRNKTLRESFKHMEEPVEPVVPFGSREAISYEADRLVHLRQLESLKKQLDNLAEVDPTYDKETLEKFLASIEQAERGPVPLGYSETELLQWRDDWKILERENGPIICQSCGEIVSGRELPEEPPLSADAIALQLGRLRNWQGHIFDVTLGESPLSEAEVRSRLQAIGSHHERAILLRQIDDLGPPMASRENEANGWLEFDKAVEAHTRKMLEYEGWLATKKEIDALPEAEPFLSEKYQMALSYETLSAKYETLFEIYEQQVQQLETTKEKRESFKAGSEALKEARKEVKRYLVPSLSKVSSHLLSEMTDGQRKVIKIDEDFEIWVDKQHVRTLSGSGVSVVNLALRIALGQVLTQSVLPFFMADEIDANMAAKRTKATHDSLKRLRSKLKQIILITHKEFEGDHKICLS